MGNKILERHVLAFEDRDIWIAAYAAWYQHFLAMQPCREQPCPDHIAVSWAREMTEASLVNFHLRDDQDPVRRAALLVPEPAPAPVPAFSAPTISVLTASRPATSRKPALPPKKSAQISLFS